MASTKHSNLDRVCRGTRDLVILAMMETGAPVTIEEVRSDYVYLTGEAASKRSFSNNMRRLQAQRLVRYPSTGRDIPGGAVNDPNKYYKITKEGKAVVKQFRRFLGS